MRVLLVNKYWFPKGGADKVALQTKELLENAGHEVAVFGMQNPENLFQNDYFAPFVDYRSVGGWEKIKAGKRVIYNHLAGKGLELLIREFKPDVVHLHNFYHQLSFSVLDAAVKSKVRTVMTLHDYKLISPNYSLYHHDKIAEECLGGKYYKCLLTNCMGNFGASVVATAEAYFVKWKKYLEKIDQYISPSQFLINKFRSAGFEYPITLLSNPIKPLETCNPQDESDYVFFLSRLSQEKGVSQLLDIAKGLPQIKFVIAGTGPLESALKSRVANESISNVNLVGFKDGEELKKLIARARIVVVPSVWYENNPLSVLEAEMAGKIVIASNLGGLTELLPVDLLCEPNNVSGWQEKIKEWFNAPAEKRQAIGKLLREKVLKENNPQEYLSALLKIYVGEKE